MQNWRWRLNKVFSPEFGMIICKDILTVGSLVRIFFFKKLLGTFRHFQQGEIGAFSKYWPNYRQISLTPLHLAQHGEQGVPRPAPGAGPHHLAREQVQTLRTQAAQVNVESCCGKYLFEFVRSCSRLGFHQCLKFSDGTGGCNGCLNNHGMGLENRHTCVDEVC